MAKRDNISLEIGTHLINFIHIPKTYYIPKKYNRETGMVTSYENCKFQIDSFYMSEYPITQDIWKAAGSTLHSFKFLGDKKPVDNISWDEAAKFLKELSHQLSDELPENYFFRLPTETEWEYAASANSTYKFAGTNKLKNSGWFDRNSHEETKEVGRKRANKFGLFDMSGNVFEWCLDHMDKHFLTKAIKRIEQDNVAYLSNPVSKTGPKRVLRGGSWLSTEEDCNVFLRADNHPKVKLDVIGFRPILTDITPNEIKN